MALLQSLTPFNLRNPTFSNIYAHIQLNQQTQTHNVIQAERSESCNPSTTIVMTQQPKQQKKVKINKIAKRLDAAASLPEIPTHYRRACGGLSQTKENVEAQEDRSQSASR